MDNIQSAPNLTFQQKLTDLLQRRPVIYQFMRFACIGFLNTGLNFLILNFLSKALNIEKGLALGAVAAVAFVAAVIQSYLWNRVWTFGNEEGVSVYNNVVRLFAVGLLGVLAIIFVFVASTFSASEWFYLMILGAYILFESVLWRHFGFHIADFHHEGHSFMVFFVVTLIGLAINSSLVSIFSTYIQIPNTDVDKNIAAALATAVSLFWNFTGYKLIVFKK